MSPPPAQAAKDKKKHFRYPCPLNPIRHDDTSVHLYQTCAACQETVQWQISLCAYREAPVDMGHLGVQVEAEDQEEDSCHHEGTAADKFKEVDPSTGRTHHDCLYADESNKW